MSEYKWWRALCGGVWVYAFWRWNKVLPERHEVALSLISFHVEDHRYFRNAQLRKTK